MLKRILFVTSVLGSFVATDLAVAPPAAEAKSTGNITSSSVDRDWRTIDFNYVVPSTGKLYEMEAALMVTYLSGTVIQGDTGMHDGKLPNRNAMTMAIAYCSDGGYETSDPGVAPTSASAVGYTRCPKNVRATKMVGKFKYDCPGKTWSGCS